MKQLNEFTIALKNLADGTYQQDFHLDNNYFSAMDSPLVEKGCVDVQLHIKKGTYSTQFLFDIKGEVEVACDRCLEPMTIPVEVNEELIVKYGPEYSEESPELIIINENDMTLNIAWILYEYIALSLPLVRLHPEGECDPEMMDVLEHMSVKDLNNSMDEEEGDDDKSENEEVDPRWAALKDILGKTSNGDA